MRDKFSVLETIFGYKTFRGGQEALVDAVLSGRDALGIMPTGAGKSLCYQVPALILDGVTIVVSPLISLMKDQVRALTQAGAQAAFLNSSLTQAQQEQVFGRLEAGQYQLLYVAPERLLHERFLQVVSRLEVSLVAVDEAHCVSQWGQDFRPSYLDVGRFITALPERPTVAAFTATATERVRQDIEALLGLRDPFGITTGFDRENLYFEVQRPANRMEAALQFVRKRQSQSGIVYCLTRKEVEQLCERLQKLGIKATRYHAGLSDVERQENQEAFQADINPVMVATNAFGMGIDKSNVSYVLHCGMPKNLESYYQEAGRAGRDGASAECVLYYAERDIATNTFFIQKESEGQREMDPAQREEIFRQDKERLRQMLAYCKTASCLRRHILRYFGETPEWETCGNCFLCQNTFQEVDITTEAQKILSCVKRMQERYGKHTVADTLKGKLPPRMQGFGLEKLSTYGLLEHLSKRRILELIDILVDMGCLEVTASNFAQGQLPLVKLGAGARAVLFDGEIVMTRVLELPEEETQTRTKRKAAAELTDTTLFDKLKAVRTRLAREQGVPPYVVFSDAALVDMSERLPTTEEGFLEVSGVGQTKLVRYGADLLDVIRDHVGDLGARESMAEPVKISKPKWMERLPEQGEPVKVSKPTASAANTWGVYGDALLEAQVLGGLTLAEIATEHERSAEEVRERLLELGYSIDD